MTLHEMIDQIEINVNELSARPFNPAPMFADHDLADLNDQLAKIQELRSCINGVCALNWKPAKQ